MGPDDERPADYGLTTVAEAVNRKRVYRLYRSLGLVVHHRTRKRPTVKREPLALPTAPNERWSMDFVSDALADGRRFRTFTLVDDFTAECPVLEADRSLTGDRVVAILERVGPRGAFPGRFAVTTGPSSGATCSISGRTSARSACSSSSPASRPEIPSSSASTAGFGTSV